MVRLSHVRSSIFTGTAFEDQTTRLGIDFVDSTINESHDESKITRPSEMFPAEVCFVWVGVVPGIVGMNASCHENYHIES